MPTDFPALHRMLDIAERHGLDVSTLNPYMITIKGPHLPPACTDVSCCDWYPNPEGKQYRINRGKIEGIEVIACEYQDESPAVASVPA